MATALLSGATNTFLNFTEVIRAGLAARLLVDPTLPSLLTKHGPLGARIFRLSFLET